MDVDPTQNPHVVDGPSAEVTDTASADAAPAVEARPGDAAGAAPPRLVAWEVTRSCNLACVHCRASAVHGPYPNELTTDEAFTLVDQIASFANPILILTGGDPLMRADVFDIAERGIAQGLRVVMSPNGTLVTPDVARRMKDVGIARISISVDFPTAEEHDRFRGVPGAYDGAMRGIRTAIEAGVEVQINSTITKLNAHHLPALLELAEKVGAVSFHPFMLVPTGRGKELEEQELPPEAYEEALNWMYDAQQGSALFLKPTDVPHYWRVMRQRGTEERKKGKGGEGAPGGPQGHPGAHPHAAELAGATSAARHPGGAPSAGAAHPHAQFAAHPHAHGGMNTLSRGCLAGIGFCFVSHVGRVQPCGYFDVEAGDVRRQSFPDIWRTSPLFTDLRDFDGLKGKCGACEFKKVCGGCRARAYEATGDYMAEEPYCAYVPKGWCEPA